MSFYFIFEFYIIDKLPLADTPYPEPSNVVTDFTAFKQSDYDFIMCVLNFDYLDDSSSKHGLVEPPHPYAIDPISKGVQGLNSCTNLPV